MRHLFLIISICLLSQIYCYADNQYNGERKNLQFKEDIEKIESANPQEVRSLISIAGYNKSIRDSYETFYVSNNTGLHITRLILQFSYYTEQGEMLTEKEYTVECDIPSMSTRQLSVKTFDINHNHYYYKSRKPNRDAIPYKVVYTLKRIDAAISVPCCD